MSGGTYKFRFLGFVVEATISESGFGGVSAVGDIDFAGFRFIDFSLRLRPPVPLNGMSTFTRKLVYNLDEK